MQRKLETKFRDLKNRKDMLRIVDDEENLVKINKEIGQTPTIYKQFSDTMGLEYQINRIGPIKKKNNIQFKSNCTNNSVTELKKRKVQTYGDEVYINFINNGYENLGIINNATGEKIGDIVNSGLDYGVSYSI